MPPLPVVPGMKVVRALKKLGWTLDHIHGSHHILKRPGGRTVSVPVHRGHDLKAGTLRAILHDAELSVEEFLKLL